MGYSTLTNHLKKERLSMNSKVKWNRMIFNGKMISIGINMHKHS